MEWGIAPSEGFVKDIFLFEIVGAVIDRPENVPLTNLGMVVRQSIHDISSHYPAITVDHAVIMPNHIHLLLQINTDIDGRSMIAPLPGMPTASVSSAMSTPKREKNARKLAAMIEEVKKEIALAKDINKLK